MDLNGRQRTIGAWLVAQERPVATEAIARALGLSPRVVRYNLEWLAAVVERLGGSLQRRRGVGVWIEAPDTVREGLRELFEPGTLTAPLTPAARRSAALLHLLVSAPDYTVLQALEDVMAVSRSSVRRDVQALEEWLMSRDLVVHRKPGTGVSVVGPESLIRRALHRLVLESVPRDLLPDLPGLGPPLVRRLDPSVLSFLRSLHLDSIRVAVDRIPALAGIKDDRTYTGLVLHVAIAVSRNEAGRRLEVEEGHLRAVEEHPLGELGVALAAEVEDELGIPFPLEEVAGISSMVLGIDQLRRPSRGDAASNPGLVEGLLDLIAQRGYPMVAADTQFVEGLSDHLDRLRVRTRFGIPVHNPLLAEVSLRYPDLHSVAGSMGSRVGEEFDADLPEDEVGFLTMYLAGALERIGLADRTPVVVVCPAGMATVWVLVARLQAEFPQLDVKRVFSAREFDVGKLDGGELIISTVRLEVTGFPIVQVHPLLEGPDVRAVSEVLDAIR